MTVKYVIYPLKGANDIEFGMHVSEVRQKMKSIPEEFRRHREIHPSDHYVEEGVFCYYDPDGHLEALEFDRIAQVFLGDTDLFKLPVGRMISMLKQLDPETAQYEPGGALSRHLSLGIHTPDDDDEGEHAPVESVLTGRPGYYDVLDSF